MLKIGSIKWRGKCSRHPGFDPRLESPGAIKGGCDRCMLLMDIYSHHSRMLALMKRFAPPQIKPRPADPPEAQANLFGEF
jgi:hypothetical protein